MFTRIRIACGLAFLLALTLFMRVFAKGEFSFITITGPNLQDAVRVTDRTLTSDFFAFADFYQNRAAEPASPGVAYEITRYYVENGYESVFDRLHYYPETGYVYYDGLVNGSSEYDGKWYTARADIRVPFEKVLSAELVPSIPTVPPEAVSAAVQPQTEKASAWSSAVIPLAVVVLLAVVSTVVFWLRRPSTG